MELFGENIIFMVRYKNMFLKKYLINFANYKLSFKG